MGQLSQWPRNDLSLEVLAICSSVLASIHPSSVIRLEFKWKNMHVVKGGARTGWVQFLRTFPGVFENLATPPSLALQWPLPSLTGCRVWAGTCKCKPSQTSDSHCSCCPCSQAGLTLQHYHPHVQVGLRQFPGVELIPTAGSRGFCL